MIGNFYDSFGKEDDEKRDLPKEVLDFLNAALPDNFVYIKSNTGRYMAVPKPEKAFEDIKLTTQFGFDENRDSELINKLIRIPYEKWGEYFYRTQKIIPIKRAYVGDENKQIPLEDLSGNPISDESVKLVDCTMQASPFPEPVKMTFKSGDGDILEIGFQQVAYDSLTEIKYANVDFPALKIEIFLYSPLVEEADEDAHTSFKNQLMISYSVTPTKAQSVEEAVVSLRIFRGLSNGTTTIGGHSIYHRGVKTKIDFDRTEDALGFWEAAQKIEKKLKVSFNPGAKYDEEDMRLFAELKTCFIEGKSVIWRHPFDHFHMGGFHPSKPDFSIADIVGQDSIRYEFIEGPMSNSLFGAEFDLYSRTEMKDFIVTNIEQDDGEKEGFEVYISDLPDREWRLSRMYMTEEDAEKWMEDRETRGKN